MEYSIIHSLNYSTREFIISQEWKDGSLLYSTLLTKHLFKLMGKDTGMSIRMRYIINHKNFLFIKGMLKEYDNQTLSIFDIKKCCQECYMYTLKKINSFLNSNINFQKHYYKKQTNFS